MRPNSLPEVARCACLSGAYLMEQKLPTDTNVKSGHSTLPHQQQQVPSHSIFQNGKSRGSMKPFPQGTPHMP